MIDSAFEVSRRSNTNRDVKPQKTALDLLYYVGKTKALISCVAAAQMICAFVAVVFFHYTKKKQVLLLSKPNG